MLGWADEIVSAEPADNVADDSRRHFEIDPSALFAALKRARAGGPQLLGYYHSHPSGPAAPSTTDQKMAAADGKLWLIVGRGAVTCWRATARGFHPVELIVGPCPARDRRPQKPS